MTSTNIHFASLTLEDVSNARNGSTAPPDRKTAPPDDVLLLRPETSVFMEAGLFVRIASFCESRELLRLCTLTKLDTEQSCELALKNGGIKKDPRRLERLSSEESWATVLRERIALDKDLIFTFGNMNHARMKTWRNKVFFMRPPADPVIPMAPVNWVCATCGSEQVMRAGVHRALFTLNGRHAYFRVGIRRAVALQSQMKQTEYEAAGAEVKKTHCTPSDVQESDASTQTTYTYISEFGFNVFKDPEIKEVGVEVDVDNLLMRFFFRQAGKFRCKSIVSIEYPSTGGYCWVVLGKDIKARRDHSVDMGECEIERINVPFESFRRPASPPPPPAADPHMVEGHIRNQRQAPGRFSNTSTRQHFDPYSSPPPSP